MKLSGWELTTKKMIVKTYKKKKMSDLFVLCSGEKTNVF